jgi:hypothetical protein
MRQAQAGRQAVRARSRKFFLAGQLIRGNCALSSVEIALDLNSVLVE